MVCETKTQDAFIAKIAGITYSIKPVFSSTRYFCNDFLSDGIPDVCIEITEDDIKQEVQRGKVFFFTCEEFIGGSQDRRVFSKTINENCIETVVLHRKIIEASLNFNIVFMHGAAISINNRAILFTAPSATGKTTHIMKWMKKADNVSIINGDKPFIKIEDTSAFACGTPWRGKEDLGGKEIVPLTDIVIMERSDSNHIEIIPFGEAYPFLLQQTYIPEDAVKATSTLGLLSKLYDKVRVFRFHFNNFKDDCFDVAYNALVGDTE